MSPVGQTTWHKPGHLSFTGSEDGCHQDFVRALTNRFAAQAGKGSATLSMAYAAAKFAESCLRAIAGEPIVECAYVESHLTELPFFASRVRLGRNGVEVRARPPNRCRAKFG